MRRYPGTKSAQKAEARLVEMKAKLAKADDVPPPAPPAQPAPAPQPETAPQPRPFPETAPPPRPLPSSDLRP